MINIKTASSIIAGVTVVGVSLQQIITRTRKSEAEVEIEVETHEVVVFGSTQTAFDKAQDVISDRMLTGYYDDKTDADAHYDFTILFNTYLTQ